MDHEWADSGHSDDDARRETIPAYVEVAPDSFKPTMECGADELRAAGDGLMIKARR